MTTPSRVTRRMFLATAMGVGGAVALIRIRPWGALVRFAHRSAATRLVAIIEHPESARAVGRAYLADAPMDADAPKLLGQIAGGLPGGRSIIEEANDPELRELVATRITADFSEGWVVDVDGWILASTEARLCALAALV